MEGAHSDQSLRSVFEDSHFELCILETGYRKPLTMLTLSDKPILQRTLRWHTLFRVKAELDQFREGLRTCDVLSLVEQYPDKMAIFFTHRRQDLTRGMSIGFDDWKGGGVSKWIPLQH